MEPCGQCGSDKVQIQRVTVVGELGTVTPPVPLERGMAAGSCRSCGHAWWYHLDVLYTLLGDPDGDSEGRVRALELLARCGDDEVVLDHLADLNPAVAYAALRYVGLKGLLLGLS